MRLRRVLEVLSEDTSCGRFAIRARMVLLGIKFSDNDDWQGLIYLNSPDFESVAGATFKGVEVARGAPRLYSEQTHFYVAVRAEKQRLDRLFRAHVGLWERMKASHATHLC